MESADNPKLEMGCSCEAFGLEEKTQKISVLSDHSDGIQYTTDKSDNFVIDMESLPHLGNREIPVNSRIMLQKSLSRKGSPRGMEKKSSNAISKVNDRETVLANYSPRGCITPEKATLLAVGTTDHTTTTTNPQVHHQITINTTNILNGAENRSFTRKNSFKRSSHLSWILDPKKVLLFFATLSSLGTILLILFTLSMRRVNGDDISFS